MLSLSVPTLDTYGSTYVVRWDEGVTIRLERLYAHRDYHIDAEITVTDDQELAPHLLGPVRTSITRTWRGVILDLEEVSERLDWRQRLRQATILVLEKYRSGAPVVALGAMEQPGPTREILPGVMWEGMPTLLYGPGGIGKSIIALNFLSAIHTGQSIAGLDAIQSNALILDWETSDRQTWWRNNEILEAVNINPNAWEDPSAPLSGRTGMVFYRFMSGPLSDDVEYLKEQIAEKNIGTVLVDSAGPACGGEPEAASATLQFFEALRSLSPFDKPLQSLIIAHVTHAARTGARRSSPFGSVYWSNLPRNVFELQSAQESGTNHSDYALHHRKSNLGPLRDALAFRLTWDNGCHIEAIDLRENAQLVAGLEVPARVLILMEETGPASTQAIAERLGVAERDITGALNSDTRFTLTDGLWGNRQQVLASSW